MIFDFDYDFSKSHIVLGRENSAIIQNVTKTILTETKLRLDGLRDGQALVLNLAEIHNSPNVLMALGDFVNELMAENILFDVAYEAEQLRIRNTLMRDMHVKNPDPIIDKIRKLGRLEELEMRNFMINSQMCDAPVSHMIFIDQLNKHNIPINFVDAPRIYKASILSDEFNVFLDPSSHEVKEALERAHSMMGSKYTSLWQRAVRAITPQRLVNCKDDDAKAARNLITIDGYKKVISGMTGDKRLLVAFSGAGHLRVQDSEKSAQNAFTITNLSREEDFDFIAVDLGAPKNTKYHPLIEDRILKTPTIPVNLCSDGTFTQNIFGMTAVAQVKAEIRQIEALTLPWLEPYKDKILDMYKERFTAFQDDMREIIYSP